LIFDLNPTKGSGCLPAAGAPEFGAAHSPAGRELEGWRQEKCKGFVEPNIPHTPIPSPTNFTASTNIRSLQDHLIP